MDLNFITFGFLFLRLAPFVLVCFFMLASIFNQDLKGLVYFAGLIFTLVITSIIGRMIENYIDFFKTPIGGTPPGAHCNELMTFNGMDFTFPLGQTIITFTFAYILYVIVKHDFVKQNVATIVFFTLLLFFDLLWNFFARCGIAKQLKIIISIILGGLFGTLWGYIIDSTNSPHLQYFAGVNNNEVCSKPSKQTFRCSVYKNGKLVSKNVGGS